MKVLLTAVAVLVLTSCTSNADAPTTTNPRATTTEASTTAPPSIAPPTTKPTTTVGATTAAPTTTAAPAPPTTGVEDQILEAITRAQAADRNCYKAAPDPCDMKELEESFVGSQLQVFIQESQSGATYENVDALRYTVIDGPTLKGDDLAVAIICRFDPLVVTYKDGTVNDGEGYYIQQWSLVPVGQVWKVSEVINLSDNPGETAPCDK